MKRRTLVKLLALGFIDNLTGCCQVQPDKTPYPSYDSPTPTTKSTPTRQIPEFGKEDLFIALQGNDLWSGKYPEPNSNLTDGPFATLARARNEVRARKNDGRPSGTTTVWLRGGVYPVTSPVVFGPEDSGPVTYCAYPGETPVLDGGMEINGWVETVINERAAWVTSLPLFDGSPRIPRQLFVNGRRCPRTRLPREDFYWIQDVVDEGFSDDISNISPSHSFYVKPGEIQPWVNLQDVDIVALHYWIEERMPIASFDVATNKVTSTRRSTFGLRDDWANRLARYYVENVREALLEPGQWYADRSDGKLYYIPLSGETLQSSRAFIGIAKQLLSLQGNPDANSFVEFIHFKELHFAHTEWVQPVLFTTQGDKSAYLASAPQAASNVPGVIYLQGARNCSFEDCTLEHIGWYGIELGDGCSAIKLVGNRITDMGAGGIKLSGSETSGELGRRTGNNIITDNEIGDGGIIFHAAVGILARSSFGNTISHNHIRDLNYTGISCGWVWGFGDSVSVNNIIEKNHIHDLGKTLLNDMGGIYLLGVSPGTVLRGNLIHDIEKRNYGGWGIYLDEGSSEIVVENNICYNISSQPFHQNYGRNNTIRNNILALGEQGQARTSRAEEHLEFTFEHNILLSDGQPMIVGGYPGILGQRKIKSDWNLFWDVSGQAPIFADVTTDDLAVQHVSYARNLSVWQALGFDSHSVVADPAFANARAGDFTLGTNSPAHLIGFVPIDISDVGPRPRDER